MRRSVCFSCPILGLIFLAVGLVLLAAPPAAAKPSTVDPVFGGPGLGLASDVTALAAQPDGKLLVAGGLNYLQRLNTDGTADSSFHPRVNGPVFAVAVQKDGKIIITGNFDHVAGTAVNGYIARLHANGQLDASFNFSTDSSLGYEAMTIVPQPDGKILIGGRAESAYGENTSGLVRLTAQGSLDPTFNASIDRVPASAADFPHCIYAVLVQSDGKIIIGGNFTQVDGVARSGFARLKKDGSLDKAYQPAVSGIVSPGALQAGDQLLVAADSTPGGGGTDSTLVRLNRDGSVDPNFNYGGEPFSISFDTDAGLLMGTVTAEPTGQILVTNGYALNRVNADGSVDASFQVATGGGRIGSVVPQADGTVFLGGTFSEMNLFDCNSVARLQADGSVDTNYSLAVNSGANGSVYSIAVQADGKVVIGGAFTQIDGVFHDSIARLNSDGTPDGSFNPQVDETLGTSFALALQGDGKLVLAGDFVRVNGILRPGLARLNPDDTLDTTFNPRDTLVPDTNPALVVQADGKILVGNNFGNNAAYYYTSNLFRLNADGSRDDGFSAAELGTYDGLCLAVQADGKILVGGRLKGKGFLTRLNTDGSVDGAFSVSFGSTGLGNVNTLAVQADGTILAGGRFATVNGATVRNLARLNADGSLDASFNASVEEDGVQNMVVEADGTIVLGGEERDIFVLSADGSPSPFMPARVKTNGPVDTLVLQSDGKILAGGDFSSVDGELRNFVARLDSDGTPDFFGGGVAVGGGFYYLQFANGNPFGYYNLTGGGYSFPYFWHADLGMEYFHDAQDGQGGAYLYDFASNTFFYTSPRFPFPYLYDFTLNTLLYYYPDPDNPGHYNINGIRYFYDFATGQTIIK